MRFEGNGGSRVDIEMIGVGGMIVSVTEVDAAPDVGDDREELVVARAVLDANHAEALAAGILAGCKELHARAVSP
jgi:hypothetical protein